MMLLPVDPFGTLIICVLTATAMIMIYYSDDGE